MSRMRLILPVLLLIVTLLVACGDNDSDKLDAGDKQTGIGQALEAEEGSEVTVSGFLYQLPHQGSSLGSESIDGIKDPPPASNPLDHLGVSDQLLEYGLNGSPFGGQGFIHFPFHLVTQELEDTLSRIEFR